MLRAWCIISILFLLLACSSNKKNDAPTVHTASISNPNGMSEMSLIMEEWYNAMKAVKKQLENGSKAQISGITTQKIYTAKTSKKNVHGNVFNGFAESFLFNYELLEKAGSIEEQNKQFNLTVTACINCHEQFCHGPLIRIKKLRLPQP